MLRKRIRLAMALFLIILLVFLIIAARQSKVMKRDSLAVLNKYYRLKDKSPEAAKKALRILLQQDPYDLVALKEASESNLFNDEPQQKEIFLKRLNERLPNENQYTYQLAYWYYQQGKWEEANHLFRQLIQHASPIFKYQAQEGLHAMASYLPPCRDEAHLSLFKPIEPDISPSSKRQELVDLIRLKPQRIAYQEEEGRAQPVLIKPRLALDQFYEVKNSDSSRATRFIHQAIHQHPANVLALKEAGYFAIKQGRLRDAIDYFSRAYAITHQYDLALQLAYLHEQLRETRLACYYFSQVTHSPDQNQALRAENALTHLVGQQTKILPRPYFSEFYLNPFTESRFGLSVLPLIARLGVEQGGRWNTKEYVFLRRTKDNKSFNRGFISQIYEDNVQILGVGVQATPFRRFPMIGFIEAGDAYDLIDQNRNRWRGDLRGGVMYYQDFGTMPGYYDQWKLSLDYYSDWYGDITYFSRYNNNVIGVIRTHQGIRLFQYKSSMLNLYITGRVIEDTKRLFFNNIAEVGPGISIVPSNRFNVQLRFEQVNGMYLPAGAIYNPYSKYYTNQLVQLLFYMKF